MHLNVGLDQKTKRKGTFEFQVAIKKLLRIQQTCMEVGIGKVKGIITVESSYLSRHSLLTVNSHGCLQVQQVGKVLSGTERWDLLWLYSEAAPMVPCTHQTSRQQFQKNSLPAVLLQVILLIDQISKSILSMDLELHKFKANQGYYDFETVSKLEGKSRACWREGPWLHSWDKGDCKLPDMRSNFNRSSCFWRCTARLLRLTSCTMRSDWLSWSNCTDGCSWVSSARFSGQGTNQIFLFPQYSLPQCAYRQLKARHILSFATLNKIT